MAFEAVLPARLEIAFVNPDIEALASTVEPAHQAISKFPSVGVLVKLLVLVSAAALPQMATCTCVIAINLSPILEWVRTFQSTTRADELPRPIYYLTTNPLNILWLFQCRDSDTEIQNPRPASGTNGRTMFSCLQSPARLITRSCMPPPFPAVPSFRVLRRTDPIQNTSRV